MSELAIDPGVCVAFGGTNARMAGCEGGEIVGFDSVPTPTEPAPFFSWMARSLLDAAHEGSSWMVAGFPGPVSADGRTVGPLVNVAGMKEEEYNLREQLVAADSEVARVLEQGFVLLPVNDGTLAAQAAAYRVGEHRYAKTGALIFGTGVGAGVVKKDPDYVDVHRVDNENPYEIGHLLLSGDPVDRFEDRYSGPGLEKRYKVKAEDLPVKHPAWIEEGVAVGRLAMTLGLMTGVDLVVPTGGVGIGASHKHGPHLQQFLEQYAAFGNGPQKAYIPEVVIVPSHECNTFEMYGAEGVMRDYMTNGEQVADS
jgi:predicted NBD/HSP70 family sugar kinase